MSDKKITEAQLKEISKRRSVLVNDTLSDDDLDHVAGGLRSTGQTDVETTAGVTKCCW